MCRPTRAFLLAAAAVLAACSGETPTGPQASPSDGASHSGYTVSGFTKTCVDEQGQEVDMSFCE